MRKTLTITLAIIAPALTHAQEMSPMEICAEWSETASKVVQARYLGTPMREMMLVQDSKAFRAIVEDAYKLPNYSSEKYQRRAAQQFSDEMYASCYAAISER